MSEPLKTASKPLRSAVLLDRDGTVIVEKHYLSDPAEVMLEARAVEGLKQLQAMGLPLVVVSNQSGVGRGLFGMDAVHAVNARVGELLAEEGIRIEAWYCCPHAPTQMCNCRKPLPGMALQAASDLGLDLTRSVVIGDKRSDVELAHAVGGVGILVLTGHADADRNWAERQSIPMARDLAEAAEIVARFCAA